ncbi:hypothetical protein BABINDRAFT_160202 [Babjeviella inositovora NRRL Y-12698]|uniref:Alanyl-transfer RNA synthetases family profile domain-containing protein n=1 Tax=Babjeviella inositovora NRRL Y-12698 TaxID=984486 RepID=A0A1E3QWF0_9ASCO|nr:uncharacterized protein BABINDRAFT_160202 [Babjeviella inositovora NRRL Y-12698]ODQ81986.1 hypothetical protein BABINDRAFT_160202 [Babjeviella inositovora NRRL Y-12698]
MSTAYVSTVVGALACQRDSYLRTLTTKVVGCQELLPEKKSKKASEPVTKSYEVELEDTVLFPEGGGQPSDTGSINGSIPVTYVKRDGLIAKHITTEPLQVGSEVSLTLDWDKRWDHMQQHTGQHLLSAVLDRYDLPTLSWSMGEMLNYIELPRAMSAEEVAKVSKEVNGEIKKATAIAVEVPKDKDEVNQEKMPLDYDVNKGVLRIVTIGKLDSNPCCGTHLALTAEIGAIALLNQQSVRGTNSRLFFLTGDRVVTYATMAHSVLKTLNANLSCQTDGICDKVAQLQMSYKKAITKETNLMKELATYELRDFVAKFKGGACFAYVYKSDLGLDFAHNVTREVGVYFAEEKVTDKTVVVLTGEGKDGGACIVIGEKTDEIVSELKKRLSNLKGGGKGKFQGKISAYEKGQLESVKLYLDSL